MKKKKNKKKDHRHEGRDARRMQARGRRTARTNLEDEAPEMDLADESRGWIDDDGWRNENLRAGRWRDNQMPFGSEGEGRSFAFSENLVRLFDSRVVRVMVM